MKMKRVFCFFLCVVLCFSLCACKSKETKAAEAAIEAIGEVTLDSEELIVTAEDMYDALTPEDQEQVENYDLLLEARETYDTLCVEQVVALIDEIGEVTLDSGAKIDAARNAYEALPTALKGRVSNYFDLEDAEERLAFLQHLDANTIKNYKPINAKNLNQLDRSVTTWYDNANARAVLTVLFQVQGISDKQIESSKTKMTKQYVCICKEDNRVDIYAPYGDNGEIMGIQYWPEKGTAQIGTVKTDLDITEYLDLMVEGGVVDGYKSVGVVEIYNVLNILKK